jgi:hypothetical protein
MGAREFFVAEDAVHLTEPSASRYVSQCASSTPPLPLSGWVPTNLKRGRHVIGQIFEVARRSTTWTIDRQ